MVHRLGGCIARNHRSARSSRPAAGEVAKLLKSQQAGAADIEALTNAIEATKGLRAPVARFVAVHDGAVVLNELIPGLKVDSAAVDVGPFPNFTALARARGGSFLLPRGRGRT